MTKKEMRTFSKQSLTIAVDIDGILTIETAGWGHEAYRDRTPNRLNIERVRELHNKGHKIMLFSARHEEDLKVTKWWLERNGVPYDEIILGKPHYNVFIDDVACFNFHDLYRMLADHGVMI